MNMADADADTKFLITKLDRIFHMKDLRKIGRVDEQDFVEWGRRAARFSGLVFSEKMEKNWKDSWEAFVGVGYETKPLWIKKMVDFSKLSNKYEISKALNLLMLKCVDVNKDGKILLPEFTAFVKPLGVTDEDARTSFNIIDVNQNGALDEMEFAESLARYELDLERSVYDNAFGVWIEPIIDNTFLIAKLTRIFDMMDLRENGRVGERDFLIWGRRAAGSAGVKFTDLMGKRWKNAWTVYIGPGFETKKAWIKKMINFRNTDGSMEIFKGINQSILKCVDIDGDGICSLSEFTAFVEPLGVSAQEAKMSFEIIDKDGNGILDQMEFAEALSRYYLDRERSVFENVFGVWENRDTSHEGDLEEFDDDMDDYNVGEATTSEGGGGSCCVQLIVLLIPSALATSSSAFTVVKRSNLPTSLYNEVRDFTNRGNNAQNRALSVNYHISRVCNYSCKFCFHTQKNENIASLSDAKRGLKILKDGGTQKINFAGGEPFINDIMLGELCRYSHELGMAVSIISNGSLIKPYWMQLYGEYVDVLGVSIDSFNPEVNAAIGRGGDANNKHLERILKVREMCEDHSIIFKMNTVVCSLNWQEDMSAYVTKLKPKRWKCFQVLILNDENAGGPGELRDARNLVISREQFDNFTKRHENFDAMIPEPNDVMQNSYLLLDEELRFLDCSKGGKVPSQSILDVGLEVALKQAGFDNKSFHQRGGIYEWTRNREGK